MTAPQSHWPPSLNSRADRPASSASTVSNGGKPVARNSKGGDQDAPIAAGLAASALTPPTPRPKSRMDDDRDFPSDPAILLPFVCELIPHDPNEQLPRRKYNWHAEQREESGS